MIIGIPMGAANIVTDNIIPMITIINPIIAVMIRPVRFNTKVSSLQRAENGHKNHCVVCEFSDICLIPFEVDVQINFNR